MTSGSNPTALSWYHLTPDDYENAHPPAWARELSSPSASWKLRLDLGIPSSQRLDLGFCHGKGAKTHSFVPETK